MKLCIWKCHVRLIALAAVLVAVAGVVFAPGPIHAQEGEKDYVDVGIILEVPSDIAGTSQQLNIIVVNNGSRPAYDVEVVVDIESPEKSHFPPINDGGLRGAPLRPRVGSVSHDNPTSDNPTSLRWSIPALGGLSRETLAVLVTHEIRTGSNQFDNSLDPHGYFGQVTTSSFESEHRKGNNESRVWSYVARSSGRHWQAAGNYVVTVSVDNPSPSPGDTVKFTIGTYRESFNRDFVTTPPIDMEVAIEMTAGLSVTALRLSHPVEVEMTPG